MTLLRQPGYLTIPVKEDGTILADLFIHAQPVLARDIHTVSHRMHPAILELARRVGVQSFVCVPLQSHNQTLGFIAGDRGEQPCSEEDLNILLTIASHVATAIDNARTYANLAQLTQHLEQRIQERTRNCPWPTTVCKIMTGAAPCLSLSPHMNCARR